MTKNGWVWTWHFCGSLEKNHQVAQTILHRNCTKCPQNKRRVISVDINSPATHSFHLPALLYSETLPPRALVLERPNEVLNWLSTMKKNKHLNMYLAKYHLKVSLFCLLFAERVPCQCFYKISKVEIFAVNQTVKP